MTHGHMHYKACEMHPILKPLMAQDNADYCQINRQTSFNENSLRCLHTGSPGQSERGGGRGGARDMYTRRSGVTSFNSCPNPQLETVSPLRWHWIRLDLTRSFSRLPQKAGRSHAAFQLAILHGPAEFTPQSCQNLHPPTPPLQQTDSS